MASSASDRGDFQPFRPLDPSSAKSTEGESSPEDIPTVVPQRSTTHFGVELAAPHAWPIGAICLIVLALAMAGLSIGLREARIFIIAGLPCVCIALVLLLTRPTVRRVRISDQGLTFLPSGYFLPYSKIHEVFAPRRAEGRVRFSIHLLCEGGHLTLTDRLSDDSEELYLFLQSQPLGSALIPDDIDPLFHPFLRQQMGVHLPHEIVVYRWPAWTEAEVIHTSWRHTGATRAALAFLVTGVAWLAIFAVPSPFSEFYLLTLGLVMCGVALLVSLLGLLHKSQAKGSKKSRNATLVVSPSGLALLQGDLKGEMRWREITKLKLQKGHLSMSANHTTNGLSVQVAGATILIGDFYHWPAEHFEALIRKYSGL
ncbi:MAG: hypothetical protein EXS16_17970 [Gemmataceae bacterium]|nr:hypothetical protein [Gemmataceae bacterium]